MVNWYIYQNKLLWCFGGLIDWDFLSEESRKPQNLWRFSFIFPFLLPLPFPFFSFPLPFPISSLQERKRAFKWETPLLFSDCFSSLYRKPKEFIGPFGWWGSPFGQQITQKWDLCSQRRNTNPDSSQQAPQPWLQCDTHSDTQHPPGLPILTPPSLHSGGAPIVPSHLPQAWRAQTLHQQPCHAGTAAPTAPDSPKGPQNTSLKHSLVLWPSWMVFLLFSPIARQRDATSDSLWAVYGLIWLSALTASPLIPLLSLVASQIYFLAFVTVPTLSQAELNCFQVQSSMTETPARLS